MRTRVAVIGAGIAGLTCAWRLRQAGVKVQIYEREQTVGGRMRTRVRDGLAFDMGASFLAPSYSSLRTLAHEVGITIKAPSRERQAVLRDGRRYPMCFDEPFRTLLLGSAGLTWRTRLRLARFTLQALWRFGRLNLYELSDGPAAANFGNAYDCALEGVDRDFADFVVDTFCSSLMFSHASEHSSAFLLSVLSMMVWPGTDMRVCHPAGAMGDLTAALAARLPVRTGYAVEALVKEAGEWRIGDEGYPVVVVATTAAPARAMLPVSLSEHHRVLARARYGTTISVCFRVPVGSMSSPYLTYVPPKESALVSNITNEQLKGISHGGMTLVNVGLHEACALALWDCADDVIFERVGQELVRLMPELDQLVGHDLERWREVLPKYDRALLDEARTFARVGQGQEGVYLCGDYVGGPWTEASCRKGEQVARLILAGPRAPDRGSVA